MYEYGARAGFWRIHQEFQKRGLPMTIFGVGMALARHPHIVDAIKNSPYDVVSHGQRGFIIKTWILRLSACIWIRHSLY